MDKLFRNAIGTIEIGVEDSQVNDPRRIVSAVRNIYAGVLLLCKQVLWIKSPVGTNGALIYADVDYKLLLKTGKYENLRNSIRTVNKKQIEERFKYLKLDIDLSDLNELSQIRNVVEHFHVPENLDITKEAIASAMPIIEKVLVDFLDLDPFKVFDTYVWNEILKNRSVYKEQRKRCVNTFNKIECKFEEFFDLIRRMMCPDCGSFLIRQFDSENSSLTSIELECASCQKTVPRDRVFSFAIDKLFEDRPDLDEISTIYPLFLICNSCRQGGWISEDACCIICHSTNPWCAECGETANPVYEVMHVITCEKCYNLWRESLGVPFII